MEKREELIKKYISDSSAILITSHTDADGDAVGSMLAMYNTIKDSGKDINLYIKTGVPDAYKFLAGAEKVQNEKNYELGKYDLAIVVDCNSQSRIGVDYNFKKNTKKIINIDHHYKDNDNFGDINYVESTSSTSELIYAFIKKAGYKITKEVAECLYVALITDTGNFRHEYTKENAFLVAYNLVKSGASPSKLASKVYETKTLNTTKLLGVALYNLKHTKDKKLVWTVITKEVLHKLAAQRDELTSIVDNLKSIKEVEVAVLIREEGVDNVRINLRSKGVIKVSDIARHFGGGGHDYAAAATISGNIEKVENDVIEYIKHAIKAE